MNRSFAMFAAAVAVGATALAGCSAGSPSPGSTEVPATAPATGEMSASPAAFIAQAADTTESAGSARITSTTSAEGGAGGDGSTVNVRMDGVVDFTTDRAALRLSSALFGGDTEMQVIVVDGVSYVQLPMFGQKWIKMPIQQLGVDFADPTSGLDMLRRAGDLTEVGPEPVDGVEATKYTGTIDLRKALEQMAPEADKKIADELARTTGTADITVWVDDEGRIVRYDQKATIKAGGQAITTTSSTTLTDFGVATDIEPPPSEEVMDKNALDQLGDLAGQAG